MSIFRDDKEGARVTAEVKEHAEVIRRLGDEVKMLRKEVEFLTTLSKRNEESTIKQEKVVQEINEKFKHLLKILELDEKHL
jgi:hypothetical protein